VSKVIYKVLGGKILLGVTFLILLKEKFLKTKGDLSLFSLLALNKKQVC
jgi:hypothetical protein